jgi:plastocyanin
MEPERILTAARVGSPGFISEGSDVRRKALIAIVVGLALIATGCGKSKKSSKKSSKAMAEAAATRTVNVDGQTDKFNGAFLAYFPNEVQVRPGDTVDFKEIWTGEPHSVTMGTLVEAGLSAQKAAPPNGPDVPGFASLPHMVPEGPGDANQNGAQPCFLDSEKPPTDVTKACPKVAQPAFNGRQSYYNSGFLPEGKVYSVKLADDLAPGAYHYYCNLHGADMSGTITVKPKGTAIPSAAEVENAGKAQLADHVNKIEAAHNDAMAGKALPAGATAFAGFGSDDQVTLVDEFIAPVINTKVGQKVTWAVVGPHTISFNADPAAQPVIAVAPDGAVHLKPASMGPAGGPGVTAGPPPTGPPPSGPPKLGKVTDGGKFDGTGFKSSGFIPPGPPPLLGYSLTFTKAGTYSYVCLVHPKMGGVVKVT